MKRTYLRYLVPIAVVLAALAVVLFFINPIAPLFLLLAVAIQIPIVYAMMYQAQNNAYEARNDLRQAQFGEDGDAAAWLAQEENEAGALGRMFWSKANKRLNALTCAELLHLLGREDEAKAALREAGAVRPTPRELERYSVLREPDGGAETAGGSAG